MRTPFVDTFNCDNFTVKTMKGLFLAVLHHFGIKKEEIGLVIYLPYSQDFTVIERSPTGFHRTCFVRLDMANDFARTEEDDAKRQGQG